MNSVNIKPNIVNVPIRPHHHPNMVAHPTPQHLQKKHQKQTQVWVKK